MLGDQIGIKRTSEVNIKNNTNQTFEIPIEIKEEIGRLSYKIIHYIKEREKKVETNEIAIHILNIKPNESSFPIYCEAIKELLEVVPEIQLEKDQTWIYRQDVPDLHIEKKDNVYYAVKGSVPEIQNANELQRKTQELDLIIQLKLKKSIERSN